MSMFTDNLFWSTPIGMTIAVVMFVCSCISIWHEGIDDNLFDRIFYCLVALLMLIAIAVGMEPNRLHHPISQSLLMLFCVRHMASVIIQHREYKRTGKSQKTKCK